MPVMPELRITRRKLPHWQLEGSLYFVTFRLEHGTLTSDERQLVLDHVRSGHPGFYNLLAIVVMPDHVHMLLQPNEGMALPRIMRGVKGVSARLVNQRRGSRGQVWQDEWFDRIIRDDEEVHEKLV